MTVQRVTVEVNENESSYFDLFFEYSETANCDAAARSV